MSKSPAQQPKWNTLNKQENRKLEATRDFLLPMLMNGQATVKD